MPVFKNKTQGQYVNVYKDILKNHSLSLRDRGMVVTLLSLPDNWEFTMSGLSKIIPDGKSSIRASLTHLEELVLVKLFGNTLFGNHALYRNSIGVI